MKKNGKLILAAGGAVVTLTGLTAFLLSRGSAKATKETQEKLHVDPTAVETEKVATELSASDNHHAKDEKDLPKAAPTAAAVWEPLPFSVLCKEESVRRVELLEELELALEQRAQETQTTTYLTPLEVAEFAALIHQLIGLHQAEVGKVLGQLDRAQKENVLSPSSSGVKELEASSKMLAQFGVVLPSSTAVGGDGKEVVEKVSPLDILATCRAQAELIVPTLTLTKLHVVDHCPLLVKKTLGSLLDWEAAGWTTRDLVDLATKPGMTALFWLCGKSILMGDLPVVGNFPVTQRKKVAFQLFTLSLRQMNSVHKEALSDLKVSVVAECRHGWGTRAPPPVLFDVSHLTAGSTSASSDDTPSQREVEEEERGLPIYLGEVWYALGTLVSTLEPEELTKYILTTPAEFGVATMLDRGTTKSSSVEEHIHIRCLEATAGNHGRSWNSLACLLAVREPAAPSTISLYGGEYTYEELECYTEALRCAGGTQAQTTQPPSAAFQGEAWTNLGLTLGQGDAVPLPRYAGVSLSHFHSAVRMSKEEGEANATGGGGGEASKLPIVLCDRKMCLAKALTYSQENQDTPEFWIELAKCLSISYQADVVDVAKPEPSPSPREEEESDEDLAATESSMRSSTSFSGDGRSSSSNKLKRTKSATAASIHGPTGKAVLYRVMEERVQVGSPKDPTVTVGHSRVGCLLLAIALDVKNYEAWYYFSLSMEDESRAKAAAKKAVLNVESDDVTEEVEIVLDPNVYARSLNMLGAKKKNNEQSAEEEDGITLTRAEALAWCISINPRNPKAWFALGTTLAERDLLETSSSSTSTTTPEEDAEATTSLSTQAVDPELKVGNSQGVVTYKDCLLKCHSMSPNYAKAVDTWIAERDLSLK